jgi:cyclophilin family peptidyl-prolyl cis-trans isomerase
MKKLSFVLVSLFAGLILMSAERSFAAGAAVAAGATTLSPGTEPAVSEIGWVTTELSRERIVFRTNVGDIAVALYPGAAPKTVAQILNLARRGVFDGVTIYRVEPGFVAQIENFDLKKPALTSQQYAEVHKLPAEFSSLHHHRGLLSMARYDDPNSAEASFSFMLGDAPSLDRKYTVFGEIVAGQDVLAEFEKNAVNGPNGKPRNLEISRADVFEDGNLSNAKLTAAHDYEVPDAGVGKVFLIFAICAFAFTVVKPIITTVLEKKKAA